MTAAQFKFCFKFGNNSIVCMQTRLCTDFLCKGRCLALRGGQIFLGATHQNGKNTPKCAQNIPNGHKINQMVVKKIE
jgi:hypothetical protein